METHDKSKVIPVERALPPVGKRVIVVCKEFQLLGYRDENGHWRDDYRPEEPLKDVVGWYSAEN